MPILKTKTADKSRTLSVRLPAQIVSEVETIRADAEAVGLVFDVPEILAAALAAACKTARRELETLAPCAPVADRSEAGGANWRREDGDTAAERSHVSQSVV